MPIADLLYPSRYSFCILLRLHSLRLADTLWKCWWEVWKKCKVKDWTDRKARYRSNGSGVGDQRQIIH